MTLQRSSSAGDFTAVRGRRSLALFLVPVGVVLLFASLFTSLLQIDVSSVDRATQRTCGSVFDSVVDRSGWEVWWAQDLDDPDDAIRTALLRTTECPTAVNRQLGVTVGFVALGAFSLISARMMRRRSDGQPAEQHGDLGADLMRLGRIGSVLGGALTGGGLIAITVLLADADSTLFLYVDRLVVAVIALIVLVPALAILLMGRLLTIVGERLDEGFGESDE